jgi:hypothetical protein
MVHIIYLTHVCCACGVLDYPGLLTSLVFFPNDDSQFSQLYNFSLHALKVTEANYDTFLWDQGYLASLMSVFQSFGVDFTGQVYAENNMVFPSYYPEAFARFCNGCSMLTIGKIGKFYS